MADREVALQRLQRRLVEDLRDQSHVLVDEDLAAVADRDAGGLLAAVLQGVEPEVGQLGDVLAGGPDAEDAAGVLRALVVGVDRHRETAIAARPLAHRVGHGTQSRAVGRARSHRRPAADGVRTAQRVAEVAQQQRLGEHDLLELGEVQALVGAVGARVGVLDAGDQHAGLREGLEELGDERDRAAHAHVDGCRAVPGLGERRARSVVRRSAGVDLRGLAGVDDGRGEGGAPGDVLLQVGLQALDGVGRGVAGGDAEADAAARGGDEGVGGAVDLGGVEAGDRQGGLGPQPLDDAAVADPLDALGGAGLRAQPGLGVVDVGGRAGEAGPRSRRCRRRR